jgi:hypothetical protein
MQREEDRQMAVRIEFILKERSGRFTMRKERARGFNLEGENC